MPEKEGFDMDLPSHPDTEDTGGTPGARRETGTTARVVIGVLLAVVLVVVVLHLTGVVGPLAD